MLSDASKDALGHRDYAAAIVSIVKQAETPFTLGLFGVWGSGKTTILDEVGRQLRDADVAYASFDVWRYEGDSFRREFIRAVGQELEDRDKLPKGFVQEHTSRFDKSKITTVYKTRFDRGAIWLGIAYAVLAAVGIALVLLVVPSVLDTEDKTLLKILVPIVSGFAVFVASGFGRIVGQVPVQTTQPAIEFPEEFARVFQRLLESLQGAERLVIGIDNLDRCTPAQVAEMLATIKTFLEPALEESRRDRGATAASAPDLCFIVAADDEALRRHLIGQELAASRGVVAERADANLPGRQNVASASTTDIPDEVQHAVSEYLRKFFNATLRVRDLLDEDIRDFTRSELEPFVAAHSLDRESTGGLIEVTVAGLRSNPRRVKQFVNNLELRLQLFTERKEAKHIQIEPDVLVVAKLAIIEEEWPDMYKALTDDPTLLAKWHQAAADRPVAGHPALLGSDPRFRAFLQTTYQLQPPDIRAYLTLKQTKRELAYPRFAEFAEMLEAADVEGLKELLAEEGEAATGYVETITDHFADQLKTDSWATATNITRGVLEVPGLVGASDGNVVTLLGASAARAELRTRLVGLDVETVLSFAQEHLAEPSQGRIVGEFLDAFADSEQPPGTRLRISEALPNASARLKAGQKSALKQAFDDEALRKDFASYLPLVQGAPDLVPDSVLPEAITALTAVGEDLTSGDDAFSVAEAVILDRVDPMDEVPSFIQTVWGPLGTYRGQGDERFNTYADRLARIVEHVGPGGIGEQIAQTVQDEWGAIAAPLRASALGLAVAVCREDTELDARFGPSLANLLFDTDHNLALEWLAGRLRELPTHFADAVRQRLAQTISGADPGADVAAHEALTSDLPAAERRTVWIRATALALERGDPDRAVALYTARLKELGEERQALQDRFLGFAAGQSPDSRGPALRAVTSLGVSRLTPDQRTQLGSQFQESILGGDQQAIDAFDQVADQRGFITAAKETASNVAGVVEGNAGNLPGFIPQLTFVISHPGLIGDGIYDRVVLLLVQAVTAYPGHATGFAAIIREHLRVADATRRHDHVQSLISASAQLPDIAQREAILEAAKALAESRPSKAKERIDDHLKELSNSDEPGVAEMATRVLSS